MSDGVRVREVKSNESFIQARCKLNNLLHYLPHLGCILGDHDAHDAWPGRPRPYGAISNANNEHYHAMTQALAERAGLPMPRVYVIESPQPNAFATRRARRLYRRRQALAGRVCHLRSPQRLARHHRCVRSGCALGVAVCGVPAPVLRMKPRRNPAGASSLSGQHSVTRTPAKAAATKPCN